MSSALLLLSLTAAPQRVTLLLGGDVIPHEPLKQAVERSAPKDGAEGWSSLLSGLSAQFHQADVSVVNLESPLTDDPKAVTGELLFAALPSLAVGLKRAGVSVATFANNHCLDQHLSGILQTRRWLAEAGLQSAGCDGTEAASWEPLVVEKNGLKVGFLAFTRYENLFHNPADPAQPHVPLVHYDDDHQSGGIDERALLPKVKAAAAKCDALIVLPHWGDEYQPRPRPEDRQLARQLVEAGAVAVVGSHPHVVQPVEAVARPDGSEAVVAFSLGNLLSNQDFNDGDSPKREGLLLKLTLSREGAGPVKLERAEPLAVWMKNAFRPRRQLGPVVVDDELLAVRAELSSLGTAATPAARAEQARLAAELAHLQRRRDAIYARVPLALRPPPPPTEGAAARP